jgi:predicted regulator of Ras-like GTPase activity (Roadblock/LC7/MglB family)
MGTMLSDEQGNILAHSFPPYIDAGTIKGAAELLQDSIDGLQEITGGVRLFDIRCELGRLIIKTLPHLFVVVLCQPTVNIQLLLISLNVAIKKLEKLSIDHVLVQATQKAAVPQLQTPSTGTSPAYSHYRAESDGKGVLLTCETMKKTAGTFWESMTDSASINRNTSLEISDYFKTGPFKKLTLANRKTGTSKHIPVTVIQHDRDNIYDGKIIMSKALTELLNVTDGDQVRVTVVVGGGILGWEGI